MNCNICDSPLKEDNGDIKGYFGICPVGFCSLCMPLMTDMIIQTQGFNNIDILQERIVGLKEEENYESSK